MTRRERSMTRNEFNMYREWANTRNGQGAIVTERDTTPVHIPFRNSDNTTRDDAHNEGETK